MGGGDGMMLGMGIHADPALGMGMPIGYDGMGMPMAMPGMGMGMMDGGMMEMTGLGVLGMGGPGIAGPGMGDPSMGMGPGMGDPNMGLGSGTGMPPAGVGMGMGGGRGDDSMGMPLEMGPGPGMALGGTQGRVPPPGSVSPRPSGGGGGSAEPVVPPLVLDGSGPTADGILAILESERPGAAIPASAPADYGTAMPGAPPPPAGPDLGLHAQPQPGLSPLDVGVGVEGGTSCLVNNTYSVQHTVPRSTSHLSPCM
jgi:hypothetical protein